MNMESLLEKCKPKPCVICFEDVVLGTDSGGFACTRPHIFHPACIFKSLIASGKPPKCPICSAEPKVPVSTLTPFRSLIAIPNTSPPENWKHFWLQDQDYLLGDKDTRVEPPGFLVTGPYPFTKQDFGHGHNTSAPGCNKDMAYYPLAVWRFVCEGTYGRKVIGYGTLIYFQGKAYRINEDGSIRGSLREPRDVVDGSITIIHP